MKSYLSGGNPGIEPQHQEKKKAKYLINQLLSNDNILGELLEKLGLILKIKN